MIHSEISLIFQSIFTSRSRKYLNIVIAFIRKGNRNSDNNNNEMSNK